jgi:hypothetical protein
MRLEYPDSNLSDFMNNKEFEVFSDIIQNIGVSYPALNGILMTGSVVQRRDLHETYNTPNDNPLQAAYNVVAWRNKKKGGPSPQSDMDIWILTHDPDIEDAGAITDTINQRAIELLHWLSERPNYDINEWINLKKTAFGQYYKQLYLYPPQWLERNPKDPWRAIGLRDEIVRNVTTYLPHWVERMNIYFEKQMSGRFLEIRAFPNSTFHLRPEKIRVNGKVVDNSPFAYYLKDWIDLEKNCLVLYGNDIATCYPFQEKGEIPGQSIKDAIHHSTYGEP